MAWTHAWTWTVTGVTALLLVQGCQISTGPGGDTELDGSQDQSLPDGDDDSGIDDSGQAT